jgi:hypothetical protein
MSGRTAGLAIERLKVAVLGCHASAVVRGPTLLVALIAGATIGCTNAAHEASVGDSVTVGTPNHDGTTGTLAPESASSTTGDSEEGDPWVTTSTGGGMRLDLGAGTSTGASESGTDRDDTTTDDVTSGTFVVGSCCEPQTTPACEDPEVAACVCALDPYCCEEEWDDVCVDLMKDSNCGSCEVDKPMPAAECCSSSDGMGCVDADIQACVCDRDPFCCQVLWDDACVAQVANFGCGSCTIGGPCCEVHDEPGCPSDQYVETCVCAADPFCCDTSWDSICVNEVTTLACGTCPGQGDCCTEHAAWGCEDPAVQDCVCLQDPYCCSTAWDSTCVLEVGELGCGYCSDGEAATTGVASASG